MIVHTVMAQWTPGDNSFYTSQLVKDADPWTYETLAEAEAKMAELKAADNTVREYYINSYEQDPQI